MGDEHGRMPLPRFLSATALLVLQVLWIAGAVFLAGQSFLTFILTGPILILLGLPTALGAMQWRSLSGIVFGTSAAVLGAFSLCGMYAFFGDPEETQIRITVILTSYEMAFIPVGLYSLHDIASRAGDSAAPRQWQFGLGTLFVVMLHTALVLALVRLLQELEPSILPYVPGVVLFVTVFALIIVRGFARTERMNRERLRESPVAGNDEEL
jgi:hypothetical protein